MLKRVLLSLGAGTLICLVAGPIVYYQMTAPQRRALADLATETERDLTRWGNMNTISQKEYDETMRRMRERDARFQQLMAEKRRIRTQAWLLAIGAGILVGGAAFLAFSLISKRRRIASAPIESPAAPPQ
jgi:hypothetical protein